MAYIYAYKKSNGFLVTEIEMRYKMATASSWLKPTPDEVSCTGPGTDHEHCIFTFEDLKPSTMYVHKSLTSYAAESFT